MSTSTIILAAKNCSDAYSFQEQMLPIRGKPAIAWVIEDYIEQGDVVIVLNDNNLKTINYLENRYPNLKVMRINEGCEVEKYKYFSILHSLNKALESCDSKIVKIVLGDTLCRENYQEGEDYILTSKEFSVSERWCLVDFDKENYVRKFYDKEKNIDINDKHALIGIYQFSDARLLLSLVSEALIQQKKQLSDVLIEYNKTKAIKCIETGTWFDLGHKSGLIKAQNHLFNSRDFNSIQTNPILGTITKTSTKIQKLADEYAWYNNLPDEIKALAPRTLSFKENIDSASLTMEMYGYSVLSELYILGSLTYEEWQLIVKRLFEVHKLLEGYKGELPKEDFHDLYFQKTKERLKDLQSQNSYWKELLSYETIVVNGVEYKNIQYFRKKLVKHAKKLEKSIDVSIMHGDFCFSNILFDTNTFLCRLIDPRGRLSSQTIYGDPRYDIAKLRHSVVGCYDFIVHSLYRLSEDENKFSLSLTKPSFYDELSRYFDQQVLAFGYNLFEIKLIEAGLFLSMIPLHKDDFIRQKIFYLIALMKINELFGENYE